MSPPNLTAPILLKLNDLLTNPKLTNQLAALGNQAFTRSKAVDPEKWLMPAIRFPKDDDFLKLVGEAGTVAVILDQSRVTGDDADLAVEVPISAADVKKGVLVACTTAVPWEGGHGMEKAEAETGWEMRAVCVDGDERYLKRGLAIRLITALEDDLIAKERARLQQVWSETMGEQCGDAPVNGKGLLSLWIIAAECLNGAYWRRRGYKEVRRGTYTDVWSCRTSFEMVVLKRDVEFTLR
jgi:hypothetical protein